MKDFCDHSPHTGTKEWYKIRDWGIVGILVMIDVGSIDTEWHKCKL